MQEPWKTEQEVEKLSISRNVIGGGVFGRVYLGRLRFKGKKPIRVAVKRFHNPVDDLYIPTYRKVIEDLRRAGVRVPKTGFVKHKGKWVQVQHLFGSAGGTF